MRASDRRGRTILLAWERGDRSDHPDRLTAIAARLSKFGFGVVFAVRNVTAITAPDGARIFQSPIWPVDQRLPAWSVDLKPGLAGFSLATPGVTRPILRAWYALLDAARPDLVIADDAPGAVLAARGRIPVLTVGSGFKVPLPAPDDAEGTALRDAINDNLAATGRAPIAALTDTRRGDRSLVFSLADFDPDGAERQDATCLPVDAFADPVPDGAATGVLFHLDIRAAQSDILIAAILRHQGRRHVWTPDLPEPVRNAMIASGAEPVADRKAADALIAGASVVVHNGGPARASRVLGAGRPQIVLTTDTEMAGLGRVIAGAGWGASFALDRLTLPGLLESLASLGRSAGPAAREKAAALRRQPLPDWPAVLAAEINALAPGGLKS